MVVFMTQYLIALKQLKSNNFKQWEELTMTHPAAGHRPCRYSQTQSRSVYFRKDRMNYWVRRPKDQIARDCIQARIKLQYNDISEVPF